MTEQSPVHHVTNFEKDVYSGEKERSPITVIRQTRQNLGLFLSGEVGDSPVILAYFNDFTIPFLEDAKSAIQYRYPRQTEFSPITTASVLEGSLPRQPSYDQLAALDITQTILSAIPAYFKTPFVPQGHSRGGIVAPPTSPDELGDRIEEIEDVVAHIGSIRRIPFRRIHAHPEAYRTFAFFSTGSQLPLRSDTGTTDRERKQDFLLRGERRRKIQAKLRDNTQRNEAEFAESQKYIADTEVVLDKFTDGLDLSSFGTV